MIADAAYSDRLAALLQLQGQHFGQSDKVRPDAPARQQSPAQPKPAEQPK